jgi:hypothetical protein
MIDEILQIGKCILDQKQNLICKIELDDLEDISETKSVINGIKEYLQMKKYAEEDIKKVIESLKNYAQDEFIKRCAEMAKKFGDPVDTKSNIQYFSYIYENEKYPKRRF